jgi:preprotein translocase subunit SecG
MFNLLALSWQHYAFSIPLALLSVFLILVILVQRGRGGGLTGALGGMGGQSAFGTKAGDLFTRITIAVAAVWILLCMLALKVLNNPTPAVAAPPPAKVAPKDPAKSGLPGATKTTDGKSAPDTGTPETKSTDPKTEGAAGPPAPASTTPAPAAPATPAASPPATPPADDAKKSNP